MRTYLVSYDLANPALNQCYLTDAIMALGEAWARPLDNVWYLRTSDEQSLIERRLGRLLDEHDGLIIQPVREEAALRNARLRWFRRRQREDAADNVIAFPAGSSPELAADAAMPPLKVAS